MRISPISLYSYNPIKFKGQINQEESILEKYGINPDDVGVVSSSNDIMVGGAEKQTLIKKILEAHDHARRNYLYGNITGRAFATNLCLEDGSWHLGTNFNNTRNGLSAVCGERTAVLSAYNDMLQNLPIKSLDIKQDLDDFKVKYLAMSSHKPIGEDKDAACPCAECLSWFDTQRFFKEDTVIASLQKDEQGKLNLVLSKLSDYLPQRSDTTAHPLGPINKMPVHISERAQKTIEDKNILESDIKNQINLTVSRYDNNEFAETSGQNIAASVCADGRFYFASKIDFTKRWYIEPLELAAAKAIEANGPRTHIDAICYVGDEVKAPNSNVSSDRVINMKVLGELLTKYADKDTLVISTNKDDIEIKTIGEYMPDKFRFTNGYKIN